MVDSYFKVINTVRVDDVDGRRRYEQQILPFRSWDASSVTTAWRLAKTYPGVVAYWRRPEMCGPWDREARPVGVGIGAYVR